MALRLMSLSRRVVDDHKHISALSVDGCVSSQCVLRCRCLRSRIQGSDKDRRTDFEVFYPRRTSAATHQILYHIIGKRQSWKWEIGPMKGEERKLTAALYLLWRREE